MNCGLGWILVVAALLVLTANGNIGIMAVLVPISLILAGVVWLVSSMSQIPEHHQKR